MRENYFVKLIKYINNVYHIDKQIEHISDKRVNPTYKTSHIVSLLLTGFLLRIKSFNQMNFMIKTGEFDNMFSSKGDIPKIDTIRNSLKSVSLGGLRKINERLIKKAVKNKVFNDGAIDGTNLFSNQKSHCDDCILKRNI